MSFLREANPAFPGVKVNLSAVPAGLVAKYLDAVTDWNVARQMLVDIHRDLRGVNEYVAAFKAASAWDLTLGGDVAQVRYSGTTMELRKPDGTVVDMLAAAGASGDITDVTAGDGLTGGGVTGAVTLAVGAGAGISVTADAVAVDDGANFAWGGDHDFNAGLSAAGIGLDAAGLLTAGANVLVGTVADKLNPVHLAHAAQAIGDLLVADGATTMTRLATHASAGRPLVSGGTGVAPSYLGSIYAYESAGSGWLNIRAAAGDKVAFLNFTSDDYGHGELDGCTLGYHFAPGDSLGMSIWNRRASRIYFGTSDLARFEFSVAGHFHPFDYGNGSKDNVYDIGKIGTTIANGARIRDLFAAGQLYGASLGLVGALSDDNATPDVVLQRDAANVLGIRNGTNSQQLNLYWSYTSGAAASWLQISNMGSTAYDWMISPMSAGGVGAAFPLTLGLGGSRYVTLDDGTGGVGASGAFAPTTGRDGLMALGKPTAKWKTVHARSVQGSAGADVASAAQLPVLLDGDATRVTGTTDIDFLPGPTHATAPRQTGSRIVLIFAGVLNINHLTAAPAAGWAQINTTTGAAVTTAAGKRAEFVLMADGIWYQLAPLAGA